MDEGSVSSILEHTADDGKKYATLFYNLDAILSVGYRVNSKNATQFRIWANRVLKEYLIKVYAIKDTIKREQYEDLKLTIKLLSNIMNHRRLNHLEATGLLKVVTDHAYALDTLDKYDYQQLIIDNTTGKHGQIAPLKTAETASLKTVEIAPPKPEQTDPFWVMR